MPPTLVAWSIEAEGHALNFLTHSSARPHSTIPVLNPYLHYTSRTKPTVDSQAWLANDLSEAGIRDYKVKRVFVASACIE